MTEPQPAAAPALCRDLLARVARAESWEMALWLSPHPHGGTFKHAYAGAAAEAAALDRCLAAGDAPSTVDVASARTIDRDRRPALILTRELQECLSRIERSLEFGLADSATALAALGRIGRRLTPPQQS